MNRKCMTDHNSVFLFFHRKMLREYPVPANETSDCRLIVSKATTDGMFVCPTQNATFTASKHLSLEHKDTYFYQFMHPYVYNRQAWGNGECGNKGMVCHASELPMIFHPPIEKIVNTTYTEGSFLQNIISLKFVVSTTSRCTERKVIKILEFKILFFPSTSIFVVQEREKIKKFCARQSLPENFFV